MALIPSTSAPCVTARVWISINTEWYALLIPVRLNIVAYNFIQTIIQAQAGSPSAADPATPGILTPKELTVEGVAEPNPFHEFTSVTREFDE